MIEYKIQSLEVASSTNALVKKAIDAGEAEGLVVRARCQSAGSGMHGRRWTSPEGGAYFSLLLRPCVSPRDLSSLSLVAGLAIREALASLVPQQYSAAIKVKWPNDVVLLSDSNVSGSLVNAEGHFRKIAGISLETRGDAVCLGIGINILPPVMPSTVTGKSRPVYLTEAGFEPEPVRKANVDKVIETVLEAFAVGYDLWLEKGFAEIRQLYKAHLALMGLDIAIVNQAGTPVVSGTVASVDERGRLVLDAEEGIRVAVSSGEVYLVEEEK